MFFFVEFIDPPGLSTLFWSPKIVVGAFVMNKLDSAAVVVVGQRFSIYAKFW
jgi:hypothetical protein